MKSPFPCILIFLAFAFMHFKGFAQLVSDADLQHLKSQYALAYGSDYNLINGIKYIDFYPVSEGHPFLFTDEYSKGMVRIRDKSYRVDELKYDVCNQQLVLKATLSAGNIEQIVLVNETILEFTIHGRRFKRYVLPDNATGFYQVVSEDSVSCLYYWQKVLTEGGSGQYYYRYLPEKKTSYLLFGDRLIPYRSRRTFIKAFPEEYHENIRQHIKANSVHLRSAEEGMMIRLMHFCNSLLKENE